MPIPVFSLPASKAASVGRRASIFRVARGALIFAATLILINTRTFRLTEAIISTGDGLLTVLCGIVAPGDVVSVLLSQWNIFGFFLGLMVIAAIADSAGIFDSLVYHAARLGCGISLRLYAEEAPGQATLAEAVVAARDAGAQVTSLVTRLERGRPEQVIVAQARELGADLIALRPREHPESIPPIGPPSIGHTARYVVDHAPCPVLLLRIATH
jgi:nucleotide-binding universal stress UspA family protein